MTKIRPRRARGSAAVLAIAPLVAMALSACSIYPKPFTEEEHLTRALSDRRTIFKDQEPITGPLDLHQAIARGLKYNYDHRLSQMEAALQDDQLDVATINMLPRLAAGAGYNVRSNESASSSLSVLSRRQSLEPSTSQDLQRWTADLTFSWNLLDFGLSYFQARQQADRALIAVERRRRVINNMVKEVRGAFWRAATAERMLPKIEPVLAEAEKALAASEEIERQQLRPALEELEYQKSLLQVVNQLRRLRSDLSVAKAQLAALINVPQGTPIVLDIPLGEQPVPPPMEAPIERLEITGLAARPELREEMYQARIDRAGVYKEYLRLMPGVSLLGSLNYDSNSYLVHQNWAEAGFRATWNLLNLLTSPWTVRAAESQVTVAETRRLAVSVAVLTQVNISYQQYNRSVENYQSALAISRIEERIAKAANDESVRDAQPELERIRRSLAGIAAELERDRSLAELQTSLANVYISLGIDPVPAAVTGDDLASLTRTVRTALQDIDEGRLPPLAPLPPEPEPAAPAAAPAAETPATETGGQPVAEAPAVPPLTLAARGGGH